MTSRSGNKNHRIAHSCHDHKINALPDETQGKELKLIE